MKKVDVLGKACPIPVIEAKKALREDNEVEVLVDNEISVQNLEKMAKQLQYDYSHEKGEAGHYQVSIKKGEHAHGTSPAMQGQVVSSDEYIVQIDSNKMGSGDEQLGKNLMKSFLYALSEQDVLPTTILFYNSGAFLTTKDSDSLEDLKKMEEAGVVIATCGLCADYYDLTDEIAVGSVTNMYAIIETLRQANRIVKP
ncbi:MAG: sulfurtransferase-like selenium metabolism protein YedF [Aerococcus sp.]|nr:sulfurtransferase-like selenium metabolism protein YedF [Aerococcus sp.]